MRGSAIVTVRPVLMAIAVSAVSAWCITITVQPQTEYQTILGFSCTGEDDANVAKLVGDLGLSAHRDIISGGTGSGTSFAWLKALKDAGVKTFFATPWSPPANLKSNNSEENGGTLLPANYNTYADMLITYARNVKAQTGIDQAFISPQNEPAFVEPYGSCVYTPGEMHDFVKVLGAKVAASGLPLKLSIAEDMLGNFGAMVSNTIRDTSAGKYVSAVSVHGYSDGLTPVSGRAAINSWKALWSYCSTKRLLTMATEISGYKDGWENGPITGWDGSVNANAPGGLALGSDILVALRYGHVSLWSYWRCSNGQRYYQIVDNGVYEASKMFYKFIRPGMVNVETAVTSADSMVLEVAFRDKVQNTLTVVLVNIATSAKQVMVAGGGVPNQFLSYRSSATEKCVTVGTVAKDNVSLPGHSITTLVGSGYLPTVDVQRAMERARPAAGGLLAGAASIGAYSPDGRRVAFGAGRSPAGVVCLRIAQRDGRRVARRVVMERAGLR